MRESPILNANGSLNKGRSGLYYWLDWSFSCCWFLFWFVLWSWLYLSFCFLDEKTIMSLVFVSLRGELCMTRIWIDPNFYTFLLYTCNKNNLTWPEIWSGVRLYTIKFYRYLKGDLLLHYIMTKISSIWISVDPMY